jgi:phage-related protein (TIGR01555 family)
MIEPRDSAVKVLTDSESTFLVDGLVNLVSMMGANKDKRTQGEYALKAFSQGQFEVLHRQNWIAKKIIQLIPDDMTSDGRTIQTPSIDEEKIAQFEKQEKDFSVWDKMKRSMYWARLYGGCSIIMGVDDGKESHEFLDIHTIKPGQLKFLNVIDQWELSVQDINHDPLFPGYKEPLIYSLPTHGQVHASRVVRFDGDLLPWEQYKGNNYYHASILEAVYEAIRNSDTITDGIASLITEAKMDIIKVKGLRDIMVRGREDAMMKRFQIADQMKSMINTLLIDADEEHSRIQTNFGGLKDLVLQYLNILGSAADVPATRMLGVSAPGLNATGEQEIDNYRSMISSRQNNDLAPRLNVLDEVLARNLWGDYPEDWKYQFNSLDKETLMEKANRELAEAQAAAIHVTQTQAVQPSHIAEDLQAKGTYKLDDEYIEVLREVEAEEPVVEEAEETEEKPEAPEEKPEEKPEGDDVSRAAVAATEKDIQKTALNGAQIAAMVDVTTKVTSSLIPVESGIAILMASIPGLSHEEAAEIAGTPQEQAAPEPPAANPFEKKEESDEEPEEPEED